MYYAISVSSPKLAIKSLSQILEHESIKDISLIDFKQQTAKFAKYSRKIQERSNSLLHGYIIAYVPKGIDPSLYHLLKTGQGIREVFYQNPISQNKIKELYRKSKKSLITIEGPAIPNFRKNNRVLNRLEKALELKLSSEVRNKALNLIAKIKEQHSRYNAYIRYINNSGNKTTFPLETLELAKKRLAGINFGWDNPIQVLQRLNISMEYLE